MVPAFDFVGTGDAGVGFLTASIGAGAVVGAMLAVGVAARWRASRSFRWGISWSGVSIAGIAAQLHLIIDGMYLSGGLLGPDGPAAHGRQLAERLISIALGKV